MQASIVVPLYNEERRSYSFLKDLLAFSKKLEASHEVILVNDGSADRTLDVINSIAGKHRNVRVIAYSPNRGKGFAVRRGILSAKGEKVFFIDADGSIHPSQIPKMLKLLDSYDVVVGTRASPHSDVMQPFSRKVVGVLFNAYVNLLYGIGIKDTLCGFKGFRKAAASSLFANLISHRWVFDVELFFRIRRAKLKLHQMPIRWEHRSGSRITFFEPFRMAFELLLLRIRLLGRSS